MRKVIRETDKNTVDINSVSKTKYYGILSIGKQKGFITRKSYNSGSYIALCRDAITNGNCFYEVNSESLLTHINNLINKNNTIYEFDTDKELFRWLGE